MPEDYPETEEEDTTLEAESLITDTTESLIPQLSFNEARVLGCLLEKEVTTPDYYPMTPNGLHTACNQSSNRNPVTDLGTDEVDDAVEELRYKKLALSVHQSGARVPKVKHTLEEEFPYMTRSQMALICVLLLRGQQTAGELRQRCERMHSFNDIAAVEAQLNELINNKPEPLVKRVPAGGGRRVETFVHLLCGEVEIDESPAATQALPAPVSEAQPGKIEELEKSVSDLTATVADLRSDLDDIKQQLGL